MLNHWSDTVSRVYWRKASSFRIVLADHTDSCRFFNTTSTMALSYIKECHAENYTGEFECRKLVISYRSVDTYLRRDCVPKGTCAWKDRAESVSKTPISDCVYTDDSEQKLECVYCCDTPLCNRMRSFSSYLHHLLLLLLCLLFLLSCSK